MDLKHFTYSCDTDKVALAIWDSPERSINVITEEVMSELAQIIETVAADASVKGLLITSGKDSFSGGADLTMLESLGPKVEELRASMGEEKAMQFYFDKVKRLSVLYRRIETCGKPVVCLINGLCLGGAFELALACHYRIASDGPKVRVGLPEIKVGLFPGGGGTQRVARLMTTDQALQMLLKGDQLEPAKAKAMKLIDEVVAADSLIEKGRAWILQGGKAVAPWDEKSFKNPSGKVYSPGGMMIWPPANAIYRQRTYDNYPAAKAILQAVCEGLQLPMDKALDVEVRYFAKVLRSPEAKAMIRSLFVSLGELNKGALRPAHIPRSSLKKIGVIGAGFMGAGIAYVSAKAGLEVVLIDRDQASADKGKDYSQKLIVDQLNKGRATPADRDRLLGRIRPTTDYDCLDNCDLVIEAVFEDTKVKGDLIQKLRNKLRKGAILASNTSTLPISSLAENCDHPEDFIGIHFFSPVDKMMLVEIIMGKKTGDRALAVAMDYVRLIKKTSIVVKDARGFFANRCVGAYLREGHRMVMEGVPVAMIENAARMAGMPVGPLSLGDEVGLDVVWRIIEATEREVGPEANDPLQSRLIRQMVVEESRYGRKNGKGFYDYPEKGAKKLWRNIVEVQPAHLDPDGVSVSDLKLRLLVSQAIEAVKTMEEGIVEDPREADVGSILGFGFAPFTGGVISYVDGIGAVKFIEMCDSLAKTYGRRFEAPEIISKLAAKNMSIYEFYSKRVAAA